MKRKLGLGPVIFYLTFLMMVPTAVRWVTAE